LSQLFRQAGKSIHENCKPYRVLLWQVAREGRSIVGVAAALPCPPLPGGHAAAAAADLRAGAPAATAALASGAPLPNGLAANGRASEPAASAPSPFTRAVAEWSPGITGGGTTYLTHLSP